MADQDELRLKLVLDTEAFDAWFKEYQNKPAELPVVPSAGGGKGKGGNDESAAIKRDIQTRIDLRDLELRRIQSSAAEEIKFLQQRAAAGKITATQMSSDIALVENAQADATNTALVGYMALQKEIAETTQLTEAQAAALQKKLFFATERAQTGFVSMSRSMGTVTSSTKDANIAFANFGRIVQDAPFGLLGISNNIDPLLVSFANLKASTGGTGLALRALGAQLMGPAGLIFMLGSLLPTALLFAQKAFKDFGKEAEDSAKQAENATNNIIEQFARMTADAAGDVGLGQVLTEIQLFEEKLVRLRIDEQKYLNVRKGGTSELNESMLLYTKTQIEASQAAIKQLETQRLQILAAQAINGLRAEGYSESLRLLQAEEELKKGAKERESIERDRLKAAIENFGVMQELLALQLTFNASFEEARAATLAQEQEILRATEKTNDAILRRILAEKSATIDDFDFQRGVAQEQRLFQMRIDMARMAGDEETAITLEGEERKRQARLELLKLGITDKQSIDNELAMIDAETARQIKENDKQVAFNKTEQLSLVADSASALLGAIFGENKTVQSAQVVVDTLAGANRAFQQYGFPFGAIAAAANIAQGVTTLRKINSSTPKSNTLSSAKPAQSNPVGSLPFATDRNLLPQNTASMVASTSTSMNPSFKIEARIDNMGLAIAVRNGESDIATRQVPFAS